MKNHDTCAGCCYADELCDCEVVQPGYTGELDLDVALIELCERDEMRAMPLAEVRERLLWERGVQ